MTGNALAADPDTTLWPVTPQMFDALLASDVLEDRHVELLEGVLVEMSPQTGQHIRAVSQIAGALERALRASHGERYVVLQHSPISAAEARPEPDVAVIDAGDLPWARGWPTGSHLVVEVALSSQRHDLIHKPRTYAVGDVPLYWVVDLVARRIVVHEEPEDGTYRRVERRRWSADLTALGITIRLDDVLRGV